MLTVMSWNVENFFTPATGDQDAYQREGDRTGRR